MDDARGHYQTALRILEAYLCPVIEWKILKAAAELAQRLKNPIGAAELLGRQRTVLQSLADSVRDAKLRQHFLASQSVREALES